MAQQTYTLGQPSPDEKARRQAAFTALPVIYVRYADIGERGPRLGCGFFALHRQVAAIQVVPGGRRNHSI